MVSVLYSDINDEQANVVNTGKAQLIIILIFLMLMDDIATELVIKMWNTVFPRMSAPARINFKVLCALVLI